MGEGHFWPEHFTIKVPLTFSLFLCPGCWQCWRRCPGPRAYHSFPPFICSIDAFIHEVQFCSDDLFQGGPGTPPAGMTLVNSTGLALSQAYSQRRRPRRIVTNSFLITVGVCQILCLQLKEDSSSQLHNGIPHYQEILFLVSIPHCVGASPLGAALEHKATQPGPWWARFSRVIYLLQGCTPLGFLCF